MNGVRSRPQKGPFQQEFNSIGCRSLRAQWHSASRILALLAACTLAGSVFAQSQPASSPQQQPPAPQAQPSSSPQPKRIIPPTVADMARQTQARVEAAPEKVFTNDDTAELPPGGISIVGPLPLPASAAKPISVPVDNTAQQAAYWKARFTAVRRKLAEDKKALPGLQSQLEAQRVWEDPGDPDSGQLYSDTYMDLLHQIDAMKVAIQNDKKALRDLNDEFHHAGGLPGWIR